MFQRKLGFCARSLPGPVFCRLHGTFCRYPSGDHGACSTAAISEGYSGPRPSVCSHSPWPLTSGGHFLPLHLAHCHQRPASCPRQWHLISVDGRLVGTLMGSGLGDAAAWTQLGLASREAGRGEKKQRMGFQRGRGTLRLFQHVP